MRMKQISARDMQEAMKLARTQLGDDAVLLHSEKSDSGIVVTFAIEEMELEDALEAAIHEAEASIAAVTAAPAVGPAPWLAKAAPAKPILDDVRFASDHPALDMLADVLAFHALPAPIAHALHEQLVHVNVPMTSTLDAAEQLLAGALANILRFAPLQLSRQSPRAMMLVGPYGAGKTTVIAKLATELTLRKEPVLIISTDTERMGGIAPLQGLSDILKCDVLVAETRTQLRNLVKSQLGKQTILIDSAGVNIYRFNELKALGELASLDDVEPVLTCPAGLDPKEAEEMASVFSFLDIERMIVTRMDAVRHFSSLFHALHHSQYALANAASSARPADAMQPCNADMLAHLMLTHHREKMSH